MQASTLALLPALEEHAALERVLSGSPLAPDLHISPLELVRQKTVGAGDVYFTAGVEASAGLMYSTAGAGAAHSMGVGAVPFAGAVVTKSSTRAGAADTAGALYDRSWRGTNYSWCWREKLLARD